MTVTNTTSATTNPYDALNKSTSEAAAAAVEAASREKVKKKTSLGQEDFLKLMTTQMTHQDPNNPMQNGEFLSQMAQFGTVSGIQDLQKSFADFAGSINSNQALQASGLVGRYVAIPGTTGVLPAGGEITGAVNLASSTSSLQIAITDSATGELVKTLDLGNQSAGDIPFTWDGTNTAGGLAHPGTYKIQATANVGGKNVAQTTDIHSKVESVSMASGSTPMKVNLEGLNSIEFGKVKQIL